MSAIRTFLSFSPSQEAREAMRLLQEELNGSRADVRWEQPAQFHATLKFLGGVAPEAMPRLLAAVRTLAEGCAPMSVVFRTLGAFPSLRAPKVVWIGCDAPDGRLQGFRERLDGSLIVLGFAVEDRPFHPHITLGRVRSSRRLDYLTPMLEKCIFEPRNALVDRIFVMKSVLTPQGAEHSVIEAIQLEGA
jgi:2'-5' RNA ligase